MSKIIISDTSCLIALSRIDKLDILHGIFSNISTTPEVALEFGSTLPTWIKIQEVKDVARLEEFKRLLDIGEASAIALAMEIANPVLIIDEKKGRKFAKDLNLEIIGTLKILLIAKQQGLIPSVLELIKKLQERNFRFARPVIEEILKEADEI